MADEPSWSEQYAARKRVAARYPTVFRLPIAKRVRDVVAREVAGGARVLDVGAGGGQAAAWLPGRSVVSVDPDPGASADHASLDGVEGSFDAALLLEVIEHLSPADALATLRQLRDLLAPQGLLVVSTPNTFHPPGYLRDMTHRTPVCYDELGGILEVAGFEVTHLARVYNDAIWRKLLRRYAFGWLFRLLTLDYAPQIVAVARRG